MEALFIVLVLSLSYLLFLAAMYAFSSVLNLMHLKENQNFRYIIVLGSGILGEKMTPLLRNRVNKGISEPRIIFPARALAEKPSGTLL